MTVDLSYSSAVIGSNSGPVIGNICLLGLTVVRPTTPLSPSLPSKVVQGNELSGHQSHSTYI